tara:strand:- start:176 stop:769 length:594 start_codon:yes stop_codon:yes gene_type:complete
MNYIKKNLLSILALFLFFLTLNSCGLYKKTDVKNTPVNADERVKKNIAEGRGVSIFKASTNKGSGVASFATANPMWRATLDTLDFMVLSNVDYGGGVIITDWYNENSKENESIKITIRFLSNEIRADGLSINVHQKKCATNLLNNCQIKKIKSELSQEIKLAILKKAVEIEQNISVKNAEEYNKKFPDRKITKGGDK